jgi:FlaA1/EpsC-like NDP-sugar epimerase
MLTLDQAIDLVLYAIENATGGEIFVRKAPACRMGFLARSMIQKYGDNGNIKMDIVGIRAGEKLHETLINEYEMLFTKELDNQNYYVIENDNIEENIINAGVMDIKKRYKEYTSCNARQITDYSELSQLLDKVSQEELE